LRPRCGLTAQHLLRHSGLPDSEKTERRGTPLSVIGQPALPGAAFEKAS
jgi:hypothetical protein